MGPRSIDLEVDRTLRLQAVNLTAHHSRVSSTAVHYLVSRAKDVTRIVSPHAFHRKKNPFSLIEIKQQYQPKRSSYW